MSADEDRIEEAKDLVDKALLSIGGRDLASTAEVADILLDIRHSLTPLTSCS